MSSELNLKPVKSELSSSKPGLTPSLTASILKPWDFEYSPSKDGKDLNLLIMFHGLGDTCAPFAKLGASLNLPGTAVLSLQAPDQLPLMDGPSYSWYNTFDRMFNPIPNPDPTKHSATLRKLLETLTSAEIGWELNRIHLFGWGQGGSMALELASNKNVIPQDEAQRFGSVVSICGPLLSPASSSSSKSQTPALVFTRLSPNSAARTRLAKDLQSGFKEVEVINGEKGKGGEDMPRGRGEWEGIMRFWGNILSKDESWKGDGEVYEVVR